MLDNTYYIHKDRLSVCHSVSRSVLKSSWLSIRISSNKQNPSTQSKTRKVSHLAKQVQETDVHCYAEKDLSKKRKAKHYPPLLSPSLSSQSDLVPLSIQHSLVIFPPPRSTVQSGFLQAPYRPVRQNTSPPPTPQELRSTGLGIPGTTKRRPAAPSPPLSIHEKKRKDRSPGRQRREGHDERTTTQDGKGDNIGKTKERMRLRRETNCKSIGKADAGKQEFHKTTRLGFVAHHRQLDSLRLALNTRHGPRKGAGRVTRGSAARHRSPEGQSG